MTAVRYYEVARRRPRGPGEARPLAACAERRRRIRDQPDQNRAEIVTDDASGEGGYFEQIGVIALTPEDRRKQQNIVRRLKRYEP